MKLFKNIIYLFVITSMISLGACSKDDDTISPDKDQKINTNNPSGHGSFSVRGELNNEYKGDAIFVDAKARNSNEKNQWYVSIGTLKSSDEFNLTLTIMSKDDIIQPGVGEYELGDWNLGSNVFLPSFETVTSHSWVRYTVNEGKTGKLIVTSSNANKVEGSFEFTAYKYRGLDIEGTVNVKGEFKALKGR